MNRYSKFGILIIISVILFTFSLIPISEVIAQKQLEREIDLTKNYLDDLQFKYEMAELQHSLVDMYFYYLDGINESDWNEESKCFIKKSEPYSEQRIKETLDWNKNNPNSKIILMDVTSTYCGYDYGAYLKYHELLGLEIQKTEKYLGEKLTQQSISSVKENKN